MRRLLLPLVLMAAPAAQARIIDRVVAVVNDEVIVLSELEDLVRPTLQKIADLGDPVVRQQQTDKFLRRGLDQLIGERLVLQQAVTLKISISGEEVDAQIASLKSRQGWDDDQLRIYLTSQGMGMGDFRRLTRDQLLRQKVVRMKLVGGVQVSQAELESFYKDEVTRTNTHFEIEAAHIVLPVPKDATAAERSALEQEARELMARAKAGEDFAELARKYSRGPGADRGGALGTVRRGSLNADLEKTLFALEEGGVGGPVRTRFGFHVVHASKRKSLAPPEFEEVEERLRRELQEKKLQSAIEKWIEELKQKAFIEIRL